MSPWLRLRVVAHRGDRNLLSEPVHTHQTLASCSRASCRQAVIEVNTAESYGGLSRNVPMYWLRKLVMSAKQTPHLRKEFSVGASGKKSEVFAFSVTRDKGLLLHPLRQRAQG